MSDSWFSLNPLYRLQYEPAQKAHVLLFPEGMIQLNEPATEILQLCADKTNAEKITHQLQKKFPDAETLAEDVAEFLVDAFAENWLIEEV